MKTSQINSPVRVIRLEKKTGKWPPLHFFGFVVVFDGINYSHFLSEFNTHTHTIELRHFCFKTGLFKNKMNFKLLFVAVAVFMAIALMSTVDASPIGMSHYKMSKPIKVLSSSPPKSNKPLFGLRTMTDDHDRLRIRRPTHLLPSDLKDATFIDDDELTDPRTGRLDHF